MTVPGNHNPYIIRRSMWTTLLHVRLAHALLEVGKELLHLVGDKVLKLFGELLELGLHLLGAGLGLLANDLKLLLDVLHRRQRDLDLAVRAVELVATLGDDGRVVGLSATVPGKDLHLVS